MTVGSSRLGRLLTEVWRNPKLADWSGPVQWDWYDHIGKKPTALSSHRPFQETSDPSPTAIEEVLLDPFPS